MLLTWLPKIRLVLEIPLALKLVSLSDPKTLMLAHFPKIHPSIPNLFPTLKMIWLVIFLDFIVVVAWGTLSIGTMEKFFF